MVEEKIPVIEVVACVERKVRRLKGRRRLVVRAKRK